MPAAFDYVPSTLLEGRSHVVVDGAARAGTFLTLSHWPGTPTPPSLWGDTSADIVANALATPGSIPDGLTLATVDHYDADGVLSLALLVCDEVAGSHLELVRRAAHAGDFDTIDGRDSAMVAFALGQLGQSAVPLGLEADEACQPDRAPDGTALSVRAALAVLPALLDDPEGHEKLWDQEMRAYDTACALMAEGALSIEERPELDLAVVGVDLGHPDAAAAAWDGAVVHAAAVHSATACLRVATVAGPRYELRYRYETWVRLASRRPRPRVDLAGAAVRLAGAEPDGAKWEFDGAGAITGALHLSGSRPSGLKESQFLEVVSEELDLLDAGTPAWDPYREVRRLS